MKGLRLPSILFFFLLAFCSGMFHANALPGPLMIPWPEPDDDDLTIRVSVAGPGDELYVWWGHIALIIEDRRTQESRLYDYGLFSFETEHFYTNFAKGRLLFSCAASPAVRNIAQFILTNRDVTFYTLDLPPETKELVRAFAENNVRPENRNYLYHHFKDNCATRIRDIIDLATNGQFSEAFLDAPGRFTLRQHVLRHTWFAPIPEWFMSNSMGQDIDVPTTVWQEMFLPSEIGARIEDFRYRDMYGRERNLVKSVDVINRAVDRPPVLEAPRRQWPRQLLLSLCIAGLFALLLARRRKPAAAIALGLSQSLLGIFFGIVGFLDFFMSFFTQHDYTWHNMNLLFINPLLLAAIPLGILYAFSRNTARRHLCEFLLKALWSLVLLGGILSMLLQLLPQFWQQNQISLALVLPFAAMLSFVPDIAGKVRQRYFPRSSKRPNNEKVQKYGSQGYSRIGH
ncbi:hypothetical protein AGMMS49944_23190 [Spirochaetia bacterium]|nr:hypothetical protein AGMMS49944_23190 [Spirochaetia bacterium]